MYSSVNTWNIAGVHRVFVLCPPRLHKTPAVFSFYPLALLLANGAGRKRGAESQKQIKMSRSRWFCDVTNK